MSEKKEVAVVVGVGPGTGAAVAKKFAERYAVAIVARGIDKLKPVADAIRAGGGVALEVPADVTDAPSVKSAFEKIRAELGAPRVLVYNAGSATFGNVESITLEQYEAAWRTNAFGAFACVKEVVGEMIARGAGAIVFTGATAGVKAGAKSAAFGPAKFAARGLAQSLARDLGPRGVHVAWINIDGVIGVPGVRERYPQIAARELLEPEAIADAYFFVAHQDKTAWTMEMDLRPSTETF